MTTLSKDAPPLDDLAAQLPPGVLLREADAVEKYRRDWTRSEAAGMPVAVVRAETAEHVQTAVRWAAAHAVPIVPRGAGSGLSGGSCSVDGCLVVSTERMRTIEIDVPTRTAVVLPGALNVEVKRAAAEHGLWYPPDPSSFEICSIGGNVATNAGGLCCVKYGVTTDYVLGLDVVLADGSLVRLGGPRIKDVAGLSLLKLFVGSEGTLGIVTRAVLRLVPAQPPVATLVATFATVEAAAASVVAIGASTRASMMELMDQASVNAVEDHLPMGLDRSAGALLIAQSDSPGAARTAEIELMQRECEAHGATECFVTDDPQEGEMFAAARRAAFPAIERRGALMLEDVGVPVPLLPELLTGIAAIAERLDVEIPTVAHAGDGNTHPIIVYPRGDEAARERAAAAFAEVMHLAIGLGGTITGEHGIGRLKRDALPLQLGDDVMALTHRIKAALDPQGILNPGAGF
ncbi:FAD-binding oxidoreductase [Terracoccus luteus]|uniref:Glycolate oxidase n=1 Tax=Terracoccus luteus TaxID=53356 RepID=A0A495XW43_9MICO|nr:FAD-linked oxidase C-terminal domain-containing protein [Terracoccus luteus]MBB2986906.1 glycolate oxidase [Terracoccus luteus]MCP2172557.1 glycolate oxidase [Terracoccus luteus]RKT76956.1 glycolate oxidase [Terracoccus luteus]